VTRPLVLWITGIRYLQGVPMAVKHRLPGGKEDEIPWHEVSRDERQQAYEAELSKMGACEMAGRPR
jgi:hypothetical protein